MEWLKTTLREEVIAFLGLFVVAGVFFAGGIIGDFFGGIGNKLFGKKKEEESNDSPS